MLTGPVLQPRTEADAAHRPNLPYPTPRNRKTALFRTCFKDLRRYPWSLVALTQRLWGRPNEAAAE